MVLMLTTRVAYKRPLKNQSLLLYKTKQVQVNWYDVGPSSTVAVPSKNQQSQKSRAEQAPKSKSFPISSVPLASPPQLIGTQITAGSQKRESRESVCTSWVFAAWRALDNWHPLAHHHPSSACSEQSRQVYTTTTTKDTQIFAVHTSQAPCASNSLFTFCLEWREPQIFGSIQPEPTRCTLCTVQVSCAKNVDCMLVFAYHSFSVPAFENICSCLFISLKYLAVSHLCLFTINIALHHRIVGRRKNAIPVFFGLFGKFIPGYWAILYPKTSGFWKKIHFSQICISVSHLQSKVCQKFVMLISPILWNVSIIWRGKFLIKHF